MPTWMKILLVAGLLLVLLLAGAAVAGYFVMRSYGPRILEATRRNMAEGAEYGRRTDNEGCLNEAVARHARVEGFTQIINNHVFLRGCLETSRPTHGFCDGVPRLTEFMKGIGWQAQQCQRYGLKAEQQCGQLFQQVQQFCDRRSLPGLPGADADRAPGAPAMPPPPPAPRETPRAP